MSETMKETLARMKPQGGEFDAAWAFATALRNLPAIVDDDYPEGRHRYEGALQDFLVACRANGRFDAGYRFTPSTAVAQEIDSPSDHFTSLREANAHRRHLWANGEDVSLLFRATELGGECGEVLNVCKKIERERRGWRGSRATIQDLADELADVVICADLLAQTEGIDLDAAVAAKFNATSEKVGLKTRLVGK